MDNLFNYHTFYFKHREILKMRAVNEVFLLFYPLFFSLSVNLNKAKKSCTHTKLSFKKNPIMSILSNNIFEVVSQFSAKQN